MQVWVKTQASVQPSDSQAHCPCAGRQAQHLTDTAPLPPYDAHETETGTPPFHSRSQHKEKTQLTPCPSHLNATWQVAGLGKAALLVLASPVLLACFPACESWALFMPS